MYYLVYLDNPINDESYHLFELLESVLSLPKFDFFSSFLSKKDKGYLNNIVNKLDIDNDKKQKLINGYKL